MTKEFLKAEELIKKFIPYVDGYVGSSFMTDTHYPSRKLENAKLLAKIVSDEFNSKDDFYERVKIEIEIYSDISITGLQNPIFPNY